MWSDAMHCCRHLPLGTVWHCTAVALQLQAGGEGGLPAAAVRPVCSRGRSPLEATTSNRSQTPEMPNRSQKYLRYATTPSFFNKKFNQTNQNCHCYGAGIRTHWKFHGPIKYVASDLTLITSLLFGDWSCHESFTEWISLIPIYMLMWIVKPRSRLLDRKILRLPIHF